MGKVKDYFMDQMEENTKFNLIFPYHINRKKLLGNLKFAEGEIMFHTHSFEDLLSIVYKEPLAFELLASDLEYYSKQEIEFIKRIIECEKQKIDSGKVLMSFELEEETIALLEKMKEKTNQTTEELLVDNITNFVNTYKKQDTTP